MNSSFADQELDLALSNYNHYKNLRDLLLEEQYEKEKILQDKATLIRKEKNLYWRKEGDLTIKNIINTKEEIQKLLIPRNNLKIIVQELKKIISFSKKSVKRFSIYYSSHLIFCNNLINESRHQAYIFSLINTIPKFFNRPFSLMIYNKMNLIKELNRVFKDPSRYWLFSNYHSVLFNIRSNEKLQIESFSDVKTLKDDDFPPLLIAYSDNCVTNVSTYENLFNSSTFNYSYNNKTRSTFNFAKYSRRLISICRNGIFIEENLKNQLNDHRNAARIEIDKLKIIEDTQFRCLEVRNCKSNTHYNQNGCEKCGVRFMGSHLQGFVPYVTSVSRETGVATLCTLDYEEELLKKEHVVQKQKTDSIVLIKNNFEQKIFKHVWIRFEQWWSFLIFRRVNSKRYENHSKSLFYVRIRKLSQLKRDVDFCFKTMISIDMKTLLLRYSEYKGELLEYVLKKHNQRNLRIKNVAQIFKNKVNLVIEKYHERLYQEWLKLQQYKPPIIEPPIVLNELSPIEKLKLVCYRENCQLRKFLSEERYHQHMKIHYAEDKKREAYFNHCKEQKIIRDHAEKEFLSNINAKRQIASQNIIEPQSPSKNLTVKPSTSIISSSHFYLELISASKYALSPYKIPIYKPRMTIGTDDSCDIKITLKEPHLTKSTQSFPELNTLASKSMIPIKKLDPLVNKVHCILFNQDNTLSVIDNHSSWGTYVVVSNGNKARKVSHSFSRSQPLQFGSLLCLGIEVKDPIKPPISSILSKNINRNPNLPIEISAIEAGSACLMYRILTVDTLN